MTSPKDPATAQDQQGLQGVGVFLTAFVAVTVIAVAVSHGQITRSRCDIHAFELGDSCVCQAGYSGDGTVCFEDTSTPKS